MIGYNFLILHFFVSDYNKGHWKGKKLDNINAFMGDQYNLIWTVYANATIWETQKVQTLSWDSMFFFADDKWAQIVSGTQMSISFSEEKFEYKSFRLSTLSLNRKSSASPQSPEILSMVSFRTSSVKNLVFGRLGLALISRYWTWSWVWLMTHFLV